MTGMANGTTEKDEQEARTDCHAWVLLFKQDVASTAMDILGPLVQLDVECKWAVLEHFCREYLYSLGGRWKSVRPKFRGKLLR